MSPLPGARWRLPLLAVGLLGGCAGFSPDGGFDAVASAARPHLAQEAAWARTPEQRRALDARVAELLREPLSADAAVQVALFNNRELQAALHGLGIAEAELVQAGRLPDPVLALGRFVRGDERELERSLHFSLAGLIGLPRATALAKARFAQVQRESTLQLLTLATETRKAWVQAVAADESLHYARQVQDAADAGAELARRLAAVGNWNALNLAREQRYAAEAALGVATARRAQVGARERLTRLLGLWGEQTAFRLPDRLPELPRDLPDPPALEQRAMASRLDVQAAQLAVDAQAERLGLTRTGRWANGLELGLASNRSNEAPTQRGVEIAIALPLFDGGAGQRARDAALLEQARERAAQTAIDARSQVREAWQAWRLAHDIARQHREALVPLATRINDEQLLRYNGMLIGVFELLAEARLQVAAVNASLAAQRDFWLADADLQMAMVGRPTASTPSAAAPSTTAESAAGH